jgi:hypothetical protein
MKIQKSVTDLNVGDIVQAHGAMFEIISQELVKELDGSSVVAIPVGKWLSGRIETGYFGPTKNWVFQGNHLHVVTVITPI